MAGADRRREPDALDPVLRSAERLFGAELNAELERGRQIEQGLHPDREPFVEPRDTKKMDDEEAALFQRDGKGNAVPPRTR